MAHFVKLVTFVLAFSAPAAFAGFAELAPPSGWVGGSSGGGTFQFGPATNAAVYSANGANTVRTTASLSVAGRQVVVPAAMRFAANAPLLAARGLFANPYLAAASLGLVGIQWWLSQSSVKWDDSQQKWVQEQSFGWPIGTGLEYETAYSRASDVYKPTKEAACQQMAVTANALVVGGGYAYQAVSGSTCILSRNGAQNSYSSNIDQRTGGCPVGTWVNPQGQCMVSGTQNVPLTPEQFETIIPGVPMPARVPTELPVPLPVEQPVINPDPYPTGNPAPLLVPTGNPVWDPVSQTWKQPAIRVVPSPYALSPWRVDLQPIDVNKTTNDPVLDPKGDPFNPNATPSTPMTTPTPTQSVTTVVNPNGQPSGSTSTDKPTPQLCEAYPDILACQKLDTPSVDNLPTRDVSVSVTPDGGWGNASATCPAPRVIHPAGREVQIPYDMFCQYMTGLRPIIIAMAWLAAAFIVVGFKGSD